MYMEHTLLSLVWFMVTQWRSLPKQEDGGWKSRKRGIKTYKMKLKTNDERDQWRKNEEDNGNDITDDRVRKLKRTKKREKSVVRVESLFVWKQGNFGFLGNSPVLHTTTQVPRNRGSLVRSHKWWKQSIRSNFVYQWVMYIHHILWLKEKRY